MRQNAIKKTIKLPKIFWDDHKSRDLPAGEEISRNKVRVTVSVTRAEFVEIWSDAEFYAKVDGFWEPDWRLIGSAKSTMNACKRIRERMGEEYGTWV